MSESRFEFKEVSPERWDDLVALFESRGSPHHCWCMVWRRKPAEANRATGVGRKAVLKAALHSRVIDRIPIGILGYCDGAPVA